MDYKLQVTSYELKGFHILKLFLFLQFAICNLQSAISQNPIPAPAQTKSILLLGGIAHIGNGSVIENSAIGFKDGKLILVADATTIRLHQGAYDPPINISGKK